VIQDLAVFAQKIRGLVEEISQLGSLLSEAGEINGRHDNFNDLRFQIEIIDKG
jgi:hypothetical protein